MQVRTIYRQKLQGSEGFTIIELMIATLIFSVVLVLIALGVSEFTHAYYAGITQTNTQNTARTVLEDISQAIQFSGSDVTSPIAANGSSQGFCIGNQRFSYLLGWELTDGTVNSSKHQTNHALVLDNPGSCSGSQAQDLTKSVSGNELLSAHMRLAQLSVTPVSGGQNLYKIAIRVVFGDDDLLYSPSGNGLGPAAPDANCTLKAGSQFCAVSELSTVVQKRIN